MKASGREHESVLQQRRKARAEEREHRLAQLEPVRYSVPEASAMLRFSVAKCYQVIKAGRLAMVKDGRRSYITSAEIRRYAEAPAPAIPATCVPPGSPPRLSATADAA